MKLLSLNLHCFQEANRIEKLDKIVRFIQENDIDICLFQEAVQEKAEVKIDNIIKIGNNAYYIAKALGYEIYFHPLKLGFQVLEEGLAIISKFPITDPKYKTISKTKDFNHWFKRDFLSVKIKGITFYNVHLGWDTEGEVGMDQIKKLLHSTNKHEERIFVCGDFNYSDDSNEIKYIKKHLYSVSDIAKIDSKNNPTFHFNLDNNSMSNNRMIDFIFTNLPLDVKCFKIVFNEEKDYVSDHSGLYLEF